jgi:hypothetical protein
MVVVRTGYRTIIKSANKNHCPLKWDFVEKIKSFKKKEMKKIVPLLFVMYLFISCTNRLINSSDWQSKKFSVDGIIPEKSDPLRFYDEKTRINYTISNDRQNLYLCCSIYDEFMQAKILRSGLEFGIDTLGKKSFPVSIKYPFGNKVDPEPVKNGNPQTKADINERMNPSSFKLKLVAEARELRLVGFKPPLGSIISLSGPDNNGITAAINFDKMGIMFYKAVIPFSTFYKNELTPADSNTIFNYRIKIDPLPKSNGSGSNSSGMHGGGMHGGGMGSGGMRGGGMRGGGMRGGGMSGGRMGSGMNGRSMNRENGENGSQRNSSLAGTTKTSVKLKLAYR